MWMPTRLTTNRKRHTMPIIRVETAEIYDWTSFHRVFAHALGFPAFYGGNMNAMIDCLGYMDDPSAGMTTVHVRSGDTLTIDLGSIASLKSICPEQFVAVQDACGFVNWRRVRGEMSAIVALSYSE